jgi:conjugal transfer pilus assembly protein TraW
MSADSWRHTGLVLSTMGMTVMAGALPVASANAATSKIARTWSIAEPDALAEIEGRAGRVPDMRGAFGPRARWSAMKAATLAPARANRIRSVVPFYTLDQDIRLPDGRLLYAKGYTFNPLSYVSLPQRLIVVQPRDLGWALRQATSTDFILLAAGRPGDPDAVTLSERNGRAIFILEEPVKARLGLTVAPVIVAQAGQRLVLTEVDAERIARKVAP